MQVRQRTWKEAAEMVLKDYSVHFASRSLCLGHFFGQTSRSRWDILLHGSIINRFLEEVRQTPDGDTAHVPEPTIMYVLLHNEATVPAGAQEGWRWCEKCEGLWFAGDLPPGQPGGICPTDPFVSKDRDFQGGHFQTGSGRYILQQNIGAAKGQENGWRWCRKSRGLWYGQGAAHGGDCPADSWNHISTVPFTGGRPEEGHDNIGSGDYVLTKVFVAA